KAGGNTFRFFDPDMQAAVDRRIIQEADLCQSLEHNQFKLFYQGLANVDHRIIGAEALLRWEHPEDGLKFPKDFIPLTEETGLILPLGHWVLDKACSQLKEWSMRPFSRNLTLSINVSGCHFHHPRFVSEVKSVLARTGADPARLMIHLNESLVIKCRQKTISIMQDLKALGIRFALDGFGAGTSSLAMLRDLPVDQLNIDGALVRNAVLHKSDATIVSSLISMGSALGLTVNAQGVESEAQMTFLATQRCDNFQGYLINHPLGPDEFEKFLVFQNGP
ncbi:MAG: EAL domain-containing protein, partial [Nitrospirota bacterium]|nr:EAL domain-containing protein [Nitrospirota bacterium]